MNEFAGYSLDEVIYQNEKKSVFRGTRIEDGQRVIVKALPLAKAATSDVAKFMHEIDIGKNLNIAGVLKPLFLEQKRETVALIMEDTEGITLRTFLHQQAIDIPTFIAISIQLCEILGGVHRHGVIHKDVNPDNLMINKSMCELKLIDFSHASRSSDGTTRPFEGSLPYMSPEQTGRVNRGVDHRTDLYSLGIIFFQMLTGRLPFQADSKMEWVHAHITKKPVFPDATAATASTASTASTVSASSSAWSTHDQRTAIPPIIAQITLKLLSKTPEDRYQSAYGLLADLLICKRMWEENGKLRSFTLGEIDALSRFQIPSKLYGRENEINYLRDVYTRIQAGATEFTLISGYSGVGKTDLIRYIYRPLVAEKGFFITGKFDQYHNELPFAPLIQAFQDLVRQILAESAGSIAQWKKKLLRALGRSGGVVTEVIPEVKLIIGETPPVEDLSPAEASNRFQLVFRKFVQVFASRNHPLIIFLDDLHWADPASLQFLRLLLTDPASRYLLLIGAFRENEVHEQHPLNGSIAELGQQRVTINNARLLPLKLEQTQQLMMDTLHCDNERADLLAKVVQQKTAGNPFYLRQLLQMLYSEELIYFDTGRGQWEWKLTEIKKRQSFTDVITLMIEKIERLPEDTIRALKFAGCIGNSFDPKTLSFVAERSDLELTNDLWPAIREGLLVAKNENYDFLHDRVQQAVYSLIPDEEKKEIHLKIGRIMFGSNEAHLEEKIYQVVNHFNKAREMITSDQEKRLMAELNLQAGRKAKASTAYASALNYYSTGLELLSATEWDKNYSFMFGQYLERTECEYLCGNYEQAQAEFVKLLSRAKDKVDRARVYQIQIALLVNRGKYVEAIELGLKGLEEFQLSIAYRPKGATVVSQLFITLWKLRNRMDDLVNLPAVSDASVKALMELIMSIASPAFFVNKEVFVVLMCRYIRFALRFGNTESSSSAYAIFGLILTTALGKNKQGDNMGQVAMKVMEIFPHSTYKCRTYVVAGGILTQWVRHPQHSERQLEEALQLGLESGDFIFASYAMGTHVNAYYTWGSLNGLASLVERYLTVLQQINEDFVTKNFYVYLQVVRALQGKTENHFSLSDAGFDEKKFLQEIKNEETQITTFYQFYTYKTQLCYLFGNYREAIKYAEMAREYLKYSTHMLHVAQLPFYHSLSILALFRSFPLEKSRYDKTLQKNLRQMKKWATICPENFLHKYLLMEAEEARVNGKDQEAMALYDRAILSAREHQYIQYEAIACELAASYYLSKGRDLIARTYLVLALHGYHRWGASVKVNELLQAYPELEQEQLHPWETETPINVSEDQPQLLPNPPAPIVTPADMDLDMETFLHAMQDFSKENDIQQHLLIFLETSIKSAGAEKGFVLLEKNGELCVEAVKEVTGPCQTVVNPIPLEDYASIPVSIIHYVTRTKSSVVLADVTEANTFDRDPYFKTHQPKSIICIPMLYSGVLVGVLYMENNLMTDAFHLDRLQFLEMLSTMMASAKLLRVSGLGLHEKPANGGKSIVVSLTNREKEILRLIANGLSNQEIAEQLVLSLGTVKSYIVNIYGKLEVSRRVQAITKAKELKLLQ